ncbi:MAG: hypothetical protein EOP38_29245 [Rubrivivax sp.]|nr:MAG: hypothetical protein EOP38_29245 [Rubrivivax sp.]
MISSAKDLPTVGADQEHLNLDFKAVILPKALKQTPSNNKPKWPHYEMARDAAAFANAYGGTILVGASEDGKTGKLSGYTSLAEEDAHQIRIQFELAITQRCIPTPVHAALSLRGPSGFVVSVNVWPFPDQVVGVRVDADGADGFAGHAFVFPLRTASQTIMLQPNQIPMLIHAPSRRTAILLENIKASERHELRVVFSADDFPHDMQFERVDATSSTAIFIGEPRPAALRNKLSGRRVAIPLDSIQSVWKDADGSWAVIAHGKITVIDDEFARFWPLGTQP